MNALSFAMQGRTTLRGWPRGVRFTDRQHMPTGDAGRIARAFGIRSLPARILDAMRKQPGRRFDINQISDAIGEPVKSIASLRSAITNLKKDLAACHLQGAILHRGNSGRFALAPGAAAIITGHLATINQGNK